MVVAPTERRPRRWTANRVLGSRRRDAAQPEVGRAAVAPTPSAATSPRINLRLLDRLTRLSAEQALVIGADLAGALSAAHCAGRAFGGFGAEHVWVGADGSVGFENEKTPPSSATEVSAVHADLSSARALLAGLAARANPRPARRPARPDDTAAANQGAPWDIAAVTDPADLDLLAVATVLRSAADAVGAPARSELAAMVAAVTTGCHAAPADAVAEPRASPARAGHRGRWPRRGWIDPTGHPTERGWAALARLGKWALAGAVLVALLLLEMLLLGDRIGADLAALRAAGQTSQSQPTGVAVTTLPVAPSASGPVTGVDLRPLARCVPGAACQLRVLVGLVPGPVARRVRWTYLVTDRCTGSVRHVAGGAVTAAAGGSEVAVVGQLTVPAGRALAVTAVISTPARAASPPVPIPVDTTC